MLKEAQNFLKEIQDKYIGSERVVREAKNYPHKIDSESYRIHPIRAILSTKLGYYHESFKSHLDIELEEFTNECKQRFDERVARLEQRVREYKQLNQIVSEVGDAKSEKLNLFSISSVLSRLDEAQKLLQTLQRDEQLTSNIVFVAEFRKIDREIKKQKMEKENELNKHKNAIDQIVNKLIGDEKAPCRDYFTHLTKHLRKQLEGIPQATLQDYQDAKDVDIAIEIDKPIKTIIKVAELRGKEIPGLDDLLLSKYISATKMLQLLQNKNISPMQRLDQFFVLFNAKLDEIKQERNTGTVAGIGKGLKSIFSSEPIPKGGRVVNRIEEILGKNAKADSEEAFIYNQLKESAKMHKGEAKLEVGASAASKRKFS